MNTLIVGRSANGSLIPVLVDSSGRMVTSEGALAASSLAHSTAYEASRVIKAAAGTLILLAGYNSNAGDQFIQLHDAAALMADGAAPVMTLIVGGGQNFSFDIPISGLPLSAGILVCNSSTGPTKTIGGADVYFTAVYL